MGISSAAEAKLEASIRPEITVMRARTSYPRRHRPALTALSGGESAAAPRALPAGPASAAGAAGAGPAADAGPGLAGGPGPCHQAGEPGHRHQGGERASSTSASFTSASFTAARTVRTATSVASARTFRSGAHVYRPAAPARRARVAGSGQVGVVRPAAVPPGAAAAGRVRASAGPARHDAARGQRPAGVPAPVRLTRRGRFVVGLLAGLAIASAVALIWLAITGQAQAASKAAPVPAGGHSMLRVVVRPGQTLWSIAEKADPAADPRIVIQQIIDDNALTGTSVNAGQVLWIPGG